MPGYTLRPDVAGTLVGVRLPDGDPEDPDRVPLPASSGTRSRPPEPPEPAGSSRDPGLAAAEPDRASPAARAAGRHGRTAAPPGPTRVASASPPRAPRTLGAVERARESSARARAADIGDRSPASSPRSPSSSAWSALAWHPLRLILPSLAIALVAAGMATRQGAPPVCGRGRLRRLPLLRVRPSRSPSASRSGSDAALLQRT